MMRFNYLTLMGMILILTSIFLPWFNFNLPLGYSNAENKEYVMAHCYMSPFILSINFTATSNTTIYTDIGVLYKGVRVFYSATSTLLGIITIFGAALTLIGELRSRRNLSIVGGLLSLLSVIAFFLAMPPYVMEIGWVAQWGFWIALVGAAFLLSSVAYRTIVLKRPYKEDSNPYSEP